MAIPAVSASSRPRRNSLRALAALLLLASPLPAEISVDRDRLIDEGLSALYDFDHEKAKNRFDSLAAAFPGDPLGPYARAMALWWELTNEHDENNPALETAFLAAAGDAADAARARIKKAGDPTGEAHLCWGGALGLIARWEAIEGKWFAAYRHGKQAFAAQEKAIRLNPDLYDAYLGVGIFHYFTATLPAVVKVLAKLIFGGNKQQGLDEIHIAMEKGRFSREAARLFMVGILINAEKKPADALPLVLAGRAEHPGSPFYHHLEILTRQEMADWEGVEREALDFLAKTRAATPLYKARYAHWPVLALGNAALGRGEPLKALAFYDEMLAAPPADDRWVTLGLLNRGRARDMLERREEALLDYKAVLKRRDVWGLHDRARALLQRPEKKP